MKNFDIQRAGQIVAASATAGAAAIAIDTNPPAGELRSDIMIYNPGPGVVHVRAGGSSVTADNTCMPIVPGEKGAWSKGSATHLAAYSPSGAQSLIVVIGMGS
jgi:hypothetical protein